MKELTRVIKEETQSLRGVINYLFEVNEELNNTTVTYFPGFETLMIDGEVIEGKEPIELQINTDRFIELLEDSVAMMRQIHQNNKNEYMRGSDTDSIANEDINNN